MNKRRLFFIVALGFAFFSIQTFFGYKDVRNLKQNQSQDNRIKKEPSISLASCYLDEDKNVKICEGYLLNNTLVVLKNSEKHPFVFSLGEKWNFCGETPYEKDYQLSFYRRSCDSRKNDKQVFIPASSEKLSLIAVEILKNSLPNYHSISYKEGQIYHTQDIKNPVLLLYPLGEEFLPLGVYYPVAKKLIDFDFSISKASILNVASYSDDNRGFYVLQNDYIQLVVSSRTASLEGINLPFFSSSNPNSIVNEIGFDREIKDMALKEAFFPGYPHYVSSEGVKKSEEKSVLGGFYPLLRRGNISKKGVSSRYYGLNLITESYGEVEEEFFVQEFTSNKIVLSTRNGLLKKEFSLPKENAPYIFDVNILFNPQTSEKVWVTSGIPEVEFISNAWLPSVKYRYQNKDDQKTEKAKLPKSKKSIISYTSIDPMWVLNSNGYFGIVLTPLSHQKGYKISQVPGNISETRLSVLNSTLYPSLKYPGYEVALPLEKGENHFRVYSGPLEEGVMKKLDSIFSTTTKDWDYESCLSLKGIFSFISAPFSKLLFLVMKLFYFLTSSWGFSIVLLTIFLRLILYPLNAWSIRSMRKMQVLSPKIQEIQAKYKKEPKRAQLEIVNLYKEHKVNPFMGCFPILIQLPFLIAMFDLLKSSFLLRGANFIPGWIDNLTSPDVLFSWKNPIFFFGTQFHLLPFILGIVMFIQQKISSVRVKGEQNEQQRQQKAMGTLMTVLFTVMFYNFPSGLNIYWLSAMILGILQQYITNKFLDEKKT